MNVWKKQMKKSGMTIPQISKELHIAEDKLEEIIGGERQMPSEIINDYMKLTNDKSAATFNKLEINQWYDNADLEWLRKDFGFESPYQLSKHLKIAHSTMMKAERKQGVSFKTKARLYNFYQDELNKKLVNLHKITVPAQRKISKNLKYVKIGARIDDIQKCEYSNNDSVRRIDYDRLLKENEELKLQLSRYEKMIDMIK